MGEKKAEEMLTKKRPRYAEGNRRREFPVIWKGQSCANLVCGLREHDSGAMSVSDSEERRNIFIFKELQ
jgi:hypothetical protein